MLEPVGIDIFLLRCGVLTWCFFIILGVSELGLTLLGYLIFAVRRRDRSDYYI
jgi:hypothetical protein